MIPPGIDVKAIEPSPPTDRARPVILHAPSSRRRKGTEEVIAACEGLDADLVLVEGLHHDEAFERYREADIVVDQLNAGWYGLFAIECMALGKPVVTFLHDEAVARTEKELGTRVPIVSATKESLRAQLEPLVASASERKRIGAESRAYVEQVHDLDRVADRLLAALRSPLRWRSRQQELRAARQALGDLRARRARLADSRRPPPAALHALPLAVRLREGRDAHRADDGHRDRAAHGDPQRLLPLLLRLEGSGGPAPRRPHVLLVHDGDGDGRPRRRAPPRRADLRPALRLVRRLRARHGRIRRALGGDELRAAHVALPRRGALGRLRLGQPREHLPDDRRDAAPRRRARQGADRRHRRQLHRNARSSTSCSSATAASSSASSSTAACCAR